MYEILPYSPELDQRLDHFVNCESINGTFLQTRQFLNYHPKERFKDASFILQKSGTIVAYFPGVVLPNNSFVSHAGSTFGGPIVAKPFYTGSRLLEILKIADKFLTQNFKKIVYKITPKIFSKESPDLLEYILEYLGYKRYSELSCFTPLSKNKNPLENCDRECRRIFKKSLMDNVIYRDFHGIKDYEDFYQFLTISKQKYNTKPVHTLKELMDLKNKRIPNNIRFRGIWYKEIFVAAIMLFIFNKTQTIHAQYIAPNPNFTKFLPTTALYIRVMQEAAKEGFKNISWGISTENNGTLFNENLYRFKESFGAKPCLNVSYVKG